jgi:hypothetical protein
MPLAAATALAGGCQLSSIGPAIPLPSAHWTQTARLTGGAATPAGRVPGSSILTRSAVTQIIPRRLVSAAPDRSSPSSASVVSPTNAKRVTPAHPAKSGGVAPARPPMAQPLTSVARVIATAQLFTRSIPRGVHEQDRWAPLARRPWRTIWPVGRSNSRRNGGSGWFPLRIGPCGGQNATERGLLGMFARAAGKTQRSLGSLASLARGGASLRRRQPLSWLVRRVNSRRNEGKRAFPSRNGSWGENPAREPAPR